MAKTVEAPSPIVEESGHIKVNLPRTRAEGQSTGEVVLLPGTSEYLQLVRRLRAGEITTEDFLKEIKKALPG